MDRKFKIDVEGTEEEKELIRTLTTLFSTRAGSQPADREFGIDWSCMDELPEVAESCSHWKRIEKLNAMNQGSKSRISNLKIHKGYYSLVFILSERKTFDGRN